MFAKATHSARASAWDITVDLYACSVHYTNSPGPETGVHLHVLGTDLHGLVNDGGKAGRAGQTHCGSDLCVAMQHICAQKKNTHAYAHADARPCARRGGGKLACAGGGGGRWSPFPGPPPLLGSRDGALKKVIDGGKKIRTSIEGGGEAAVVVFMSG